jgi:hypothetical protein
MSPVAPRYFSTLVPFSCLLPTAAGASAPIEPPGSLSCCVAGSDAGGGAALPLAVAPAGLSEAAALAAAAASVASRPAGKAALWPAICAAAAAGAGPATERAPDELATSIREPNPPWLPAACRCPSLPAPAGPLLCRES